MKFIKLTKKDGSPVYININYITDIFQYPTSPLYPEGCTVVGLVGDNDNCYHVKESATDILTQIEEA